MSEQKPIPFTQYLCPNGIPRYVWIDRPKEITDKALEIIEAGYCFEAEILTTGQVSLTIVSTLDGDNAGIEICNNGLMIPSAVDYLITGFHEILSRNKEKAMK